MGYPAGQPRGATPERPRKSFALLAFVVSAVLFIGCGAFTVWAYTRTEPPRAVAQPPAAAPAPVEAGPPEWEPYVEAGTRMATDLTTVDYRTIDVDVQRILDGSTGGFHSDFAERAEPFKATTRVAQSVSTGTVKGAGLEEIRGDRAQVLVVVDVETTSRDSATPTPRSWRVRVGVVHDGEQYLADSVEFV